MTASTAAPLPVLYLSPAGPPGLVDDLLLGEVAACVAAVGHRLHVAPPGSAHEAVARWTAEAGREPVVVLAGRTGPAGGPDRVRTPSGRAVPVVGVALDGTGAADLTLPRRSRSLCRLLAHGARGPGEGGLPGRAVVLLHHGPGGGGDDDWPGLAWGLALLLAGPGRGALLDLQGPEGTLRGRLGPTGDPAPGAQGPPVLGSAVVPVPGPAFAARLPAAGPVRWWGTGGERPDPRAPELLGGLGAVLDTFDWAVLDAGRDAALAGALGAEGLPVLECARPGPRVRRRGAPADTAVDLGVRDWSGRSWASWSRAARRRPGLGLGARLAAVLAGPTGTPGAGRPPGPAPSPVLADPAAATDPADPAGPAGPRRVAAGA
ncbi:hypothetical protein E7744_03275 [Citricoccus sp. SGAir0253]|uniref:hypothetical protein n=1 Tax=Citricoccus sp. SGAir0253 TaxID=2567881 RepID=UPI0010CCDE10|nr:hypothetical protein [Citricoccus sp. SGAir0253]QCU77346.1 hypothetical protein E7744_03275 [Citricoccus sp. SGAir0253]